MRYAITTLLVLAFLFAGCSGVQISTDDNAAATVLVKGGARFVAYSIVKNNQQLCDKVVAFNKLLGVQDSKTPEFEKMVKFGVQYVLGEIAGKNDVLEKTFNEVLSLLHFEAGPPDWDISLIFAAIDAFTEGATLACQEGAPEAEFIAPDGEYVYTAPNSIAPPNWN